MELEQAYIFRDPRLTTMVYVQICAIYSAIWCSVPQCAIWNEVLFNTGVMARKHHSLVELEQTSIFCDSQFTTMVYV